MPALPPGPKAPPLSAASAPSKPTPPPPAAAPPKPASPPPPLAAPKPTSPPPPAAATKPTPQAQAAEKVRTTYKRLSDAAVDLNAASDELAKPIQIWESALKKLNLGVPAWVEISSGGDEGDHWWDRSVGYTKLKDRWGIALRTRAGNYPYPEESSEELWAFNEAPRWMRIESVGKLPELLDALLKQAEETTQKIRAKIGQANELAEAISRVADDKAALTKGK